jgi:hypothetical protein
VGYYNVSGHRYAPNRFPIYEAYTSGDSYSYYAVPFASQADFSIGKFAVGLTNGQPISVSLYSNNSISNLPQTLLGVATIQSIFYQSNNYSYIDNGYSLSSSYGSFVDSAGQVFWAPGGLQGIFSPGISLSLGSKYWLVIKWSNNYPHDLRYSYVLDLDSQSNSAPWDYSQLQGSSDGINWFPWGFGNSANRIQPAMLFTN